MANTLTNKTLLALMSAIIDGCDQIASINSDTCMSQVTVVDRAVLLLREVDTRINRDGSLKEPEEPES